MCSASLDTTLLMNLPFNAGLASQRRLTAELAVRRGHAFVTAPCMALMLGGWGVVSRVMRHVGHVTLTEGILLGMIVVLGPPTLAWGWWSYSVPRWRHWALSRGVDRDELQQLAQASGLVWPRGHLLSRTEFRYRPPER